MLEVNYVALFNRLADDVDLDPFSRGYCLSRINSEGLQFLTETLPRLLKSVLLSLEVGYFIRPLGFAYKGRSLRYFRSLLDAIFDIRTGLVVDTVCDVALWRLKQLCEYFYKLAVPYKETLVNDKIEKFRENDAFLGNAPIDHEWVDQLRKDFETHYSEISRAEVDDVFRDSRPRPGKGTFLGANHMKKWWTLRYQQMPVMDELRGYSGFFKPYPGSPSRRLKFGHDNFLSELLLVPKDSRGPRTIVRETFGRLCAQLGFHDWITSRLEKATSNRVNFVNQSVNRELARLSSKSKEWSTLDLKDASDMVCYRIMFRLFEFSPACRFFLNKVRATSCIVKKSTLKSGDPLAVVHDLVETQSSKEIVALHKVAGMGSGLTFPLMSLLISLTVTRAIVNATGLSYCAARRLVYVYGDDVVVPREYYELARQSLGRVFLCVNDAKSFSNSHFRESCGGEYWNGSDVTPVRLKLSACDLEVSTSRQQITAKKGKEAAFCLQVNAHAKELRRNGHLALANFFYGVLEAYLGRLPLISGESPVIGRWRYSPFDYDKDSTGQYKKVKCWTVTPKTDVVKDYDPYTFLGQRLSRSPASPLDVFFGHGSGSAYPEVSVPRTYVLRRTKVSAFRLMG